MGLRESKKQQTRQEIADQAMRLFATRGFDHVTVADVAAAANVSEKTVFNYFPTKEDLFFDEVPEREAAMVAAIRDRRPGESILAALRRQQLEHCQRMASPDFVHFARMIEASQALKAKELEVMAHFVEALAGAIADELHVEERDAWVAAGLIISIQWQLFRTARARAIAGKHGPTAARRLRADLDRMFQLLEHGLHTLEDRSSRPNSSPIPLT